MADASNREEWKKIAEAITQETDPKNYFSSLRSYATPWTVPKARGSS